MNNAIIVSFIKEAIPEFDDDAWNEGKNEQKVASRTFVKNENISRLINRQ